MRALIVILLSCLLIEEIGQERDSVPRSPKLESEIVFIDGVAYKLWETEP